VTHVLIIGADIGAAEAWSLRRLDLRDNRSRRDPDVHLQTWRVSTPPSAAFLDFMQQRTQHLLGQPSRQLMNRCMCLIERGQERRGHGSVPEGHYRLVDGVCGATQFVSHKGCSARKRDLRCLGRKGYRPCNMTQVLPSPEPLGGVSDGSGEGPGRPPGRASAASLWRPTRAAISRTGKP
jgi:hypothetical protein